MCQTILLQFTLHFEQDPLNDNCTLPLTLLLPHRPFTSICPLFRNLNSFFWEQTCLVGPQAPSHAFAQGRVEARGWRLKSLFPGDRGREVATVLDLRIITSVCVFRSMLVTRANPVLSYIKRRQILCLSPHLLLVPCRQSLKSFVANARRSEHSHDLCIVTEQRTQSRFHQQLGPKSQNRSH